MFLLDYFFIFFIANPFGLVLFIAGLVYAEYFVASSIANDPGHIRTVKFLARSVNKAKAIKVPVVIKVPIKEVVHRIKTRKYGIIKP